MYEVTLKSSYNLSKTKGFSGHTFADQQGYLFKKLYLEIAGDFSTDEVKG